MPLQLLFVISMIVTFIILSLVFGSELSKKNFIFCTIFTIVDIILVLGILNCILG